MCPRALPCTRNRLNLLQNARVVVSNVIGAIQRPEPLMLIGTTFCITSPSKYSLWRHFLSMTHLKNEERCKWYWHRRCLECHPLCLKFIQQHFHFAMSCSAWTFLLRSLLPRPRRNVPLMLLRQILAQDVQWFGLLLHQVAIAEAHESVCIDGTRAIVETHI